MNITVRYCQLHKALKSLGFSRTPLTNGASYYHAGHNALIMLQHMRPDDKISGPVMASIHDTIVRQEVLSRAQWQDLLVEYALPILENVSV
jgi:hypothetical protein